MELIRLRFEVFGRVQGVFFRDSTRKFALANNIKGWVKNTDRLTVIGEGEGAAGNIQDFRRWLREIGSPQSSITNAHFDEEPIIDLTFNTFTIK